MKKCTLALGGFSAFFVFVGSLLAWSTVDVFGETFGIRGTASGFFGVWTLLLSVLCALIITWRGANIPARLDLSSKLTESQLNMVDMGTKIALPVAAALIFLLALLDFIDVATSGLDGVSVGFGLYVTLIGAIGLIAVGVKNLRKGKESGAKPEPGA